VQKLLSSKNIKIKIYGTIIFPVLQRDEVTREWRILHKAELNDLYSSPNII
jgi:hypothetical protein